MELQRVGHDWACTLCVCVSTQILRFFCSSSVKNIIDNLIRISLYSRASLIAQLVKICLPCRRPQFISWGKKIHWRRDRLPTPIFLGFPRGSAGKESACNAGDLGSIPGLGRYPGEGIGYPLQYSGLGNPMDRGARQVAKSQTWLSDFHFHFLYHWALRKAPWVSLRTY